MDRLYRMILVLVLPALAAAASAEPSLELSGAWVRALPPGQPATAGYLTVRNAGADGVRITGASADSAGRVEIHTSRQEGDMVSMHKVPELALAPGEEVRFAPGGLHLMLLDLARMPAPGERVQLCLKTAAGDRSCTDAEVRRGGGQDHHGHH